jgi:hypothetical protein
VAPGPLLRHAADGRFDALRGDSHVLQHGAAQVSVLFAAQRERRLDPHPVPRARAYALDEDRHHQGTRPHREAQGRVARAGETSEERHEHACTARAVLVERHREDAAFGQRAQRGARSGSARHQIRAAAAAPLGQQLVERLAFARTVDDDGAVAVRRHQRGEQLPVAEVCGEDHDAAAAGDGGVEVRASLDLRQGAQGLGPMAVQRGQLDEAAPEVRERLLQDAAPARLAPFRKRDAQVAQRRGGARASQTRPRASERRAQRERALVRQLREQRRDAAQRERSAAVAERVEAAATVRRFARAQAPGSDASSASSSAITSRSIWRKRATARSKRSGSPRCTASSRALRRTQSMCQPSSCVTARSTSRVRSGTSGRLRCS